MLETNAALQNKIEQATVKALYYYPIKSCAGIAVSEAEVLPTGFRHDRELAIINPQTNKAFTQRDFHQLALLKPQITASTLTVEAPTQPPLKITLTTEGSPAKIKIWEDECFVVDQGEEAAQWFANYLGAPCRLVKMAPGFARKVNPLYAVTPDDHVSFADDFPYTIISEESLAALNERLDQPIPMNRFRPTIVIGGSGIPHAEDLIADFQIGEIVFHAVKECPRCVVPTIDQETAEASHEPSRTLARYRRASDGGIVFAQFLIPQNTGLLHVGAKIKVLALKSQEPMAKAGGL